MKNGNLKRSVVLLFYHDPGGVQVGSFVKVGKFDEKGLVVYHNDLDESLIVNAYKVVDLIFQMYLKAKISYDQDIRVEDYPFAREAVREAIYNAIAHNCYMYGTLIQIKITEDEMTISNRCILPENWTVETLMEKHDSIPYNPEIANVFYRARFIENWRQGIQKICDGCKEIGAEIPVYELRGTTLRIRFKALKKALIDQLKDPKDQADTLADTLPDSIITLIKSKPHITQGEMAEVIKVSVPSIKRTMKLLSDSGRVSWNFILLISQFYSTHILTILIIIIKRHG